MRGGVAAARVQKCMCAARFCTLAERKARANEASRGPDHQHRPSARLSPRTECEHEYTSAGGMNYNERSHQRKMVELQLHLPAAGGS